MNKCPATHSLKANVTTQTLMFEQKGNMWIHNHPETLEELKMKWKQEERPVKKKKITAKNKNKRRLDDDEPLPSTSKCSDEQQQWLQQKKKMKKQEKLNNQKAQTIERVKLIKINFFFLYIRGKWYKRAG